MFWPTHPAGTHSPTPSPPSLTSRYTSMSTRHTHTHTDCKGAKGERGEHKKCSVCVSRAGQSRAGKRAGAVAGMGRGCINLECLCQSAESQLEVHNLALIFWGLSRGSKRAYTYLQIIFYIIHISYVYNNYEYQDKQNTISVAKSVNF